MKRASFVLPLLLSFAVIVAAQSEQAAPVTVPCVAEKCQVIDRWNEAVKLHKEDFEDLARLQESIIADPPGLTVSLDRQGTLEQLKARAEAEAANYTRMQTVIERLRSRACDQAANYKRMLEVEKKR